MWETPLKTSIAHHELRNQHPSAHEDRYVTVSCRLKPLLLNEERSKIQIDKQARTMTLNDPTKSISKTYAFDQIFDEFTGQAAFANYYCGSLIEFLKKGGDSGLIFSYGITNSGKTYSILGTNEQPGILLTLIKRLQQEFKYDKIKIIACELYKDEFFSLKNKGEKLFPKELKGTFTFEEWEGDIINENNMEELFATYLQNRSCGSTSYNSTSSRSHAIFKISTEKFKIGVVDLAGSQRSSKRATEMTDRKETIFINSSLLTLKKCIISLQSRSHSSQKIMVPYRQSKLTQSLVQYFVPNSRINIIVNINQAQNYLEQNLNVMDYTSKAKNITSNSNSDFAIMMKNSNAKIEQIKSALKSYKKNQPNSKEKTVFQSHKAHKSNIREDSEQSKTQIHFDQTQLQSISQVQQKHQGKHSGYQSLIDPSTSPHFKVIIEEIIPGEQDPQDFSYYSEKKRYSVKFQGEEHEYQVEDQTFQKPELIQNLQNQIKSVQRGMLIDRKLSDALKEHAAQIPKPIQDYYDYQVRFKQYLQIDRDIEAQRDQRQLSALRKVDLWETTHKKINTQNQEEEERQNVSHRKIDESHDEIGIGTEYHIFIERQQVHQTIANFDFQGLNTATKRQILKVLNEDHKTKMVKAQTDFSNERNRSRSIDHAYVQQKCQKIHRYQEQTQIQDSNYSTPRKNLINPLSVQEKPGQQSQQSRQMSTPLQKNVFQKTITKITEGITSGMHSGFQGIRSGLKIVANGLGMTSNVFRTNNKMLKTVRSYSEEIRHLTIRPQLGEKIIPTQKLYYQMATNTVVDIIKSEKKVTIMEQNHRKSHVNEYGEIQIDQISKIGHRKITLQTFQVGIQTDHIEVKFTLHDAYQQAIYEHQQSFRNPNKGPQKLYKNEQEKQAQRKRIQKQEKLAFKPSSVKKAEFDFSVLKKRKGFMSSVKKAVAKNTRAAQRKRQQNNLQR